MHSCSLDGIWEGGFTLKLGLVGFVLVSVGFALKRGLVGFVLVLVFHVLLESTRNSFSG